MDSERSQSEASTRLVETQPSRPLSRLGFTQVASESSTSPTSRRIAWTQARGDRILTGIGRDRFTCNIK